MDRNRLLLLVLVALPSALFGAVDDPQATSPAQLLAGDPAIVFGPSPPPPLEIRRSLLVWRDRYDRQIGPVATSWNELLESLDQFHLWSLEGRCDQFKETISAFEVSVPLPAPDRLVDLHLRSLLGHLGAASRICSKRHYFEIVHRLDEASYTLRQLDLALGRLLDDGDEGSTAPTQSHRSAAAADSSPKVGDLLGRGEE